MTRSRTREITSARWRWWGSPRLSPLAGAWYPYRGVRGSPNGLSNFRSTAEGQPCYLEGSRLVAGVVSQTFSCARAGRWPRASCDRRRLLLEACGHPNLRTHTTAESHQSQRGTLYLAGFSSPVATAEHVWAWSSGQEAEITVGGETGDLMQDEAPSRRPPTNARQRGSCCGSGILGICVRDWGAPL